MGKLNPESSWLQRYPEFTGHDGELYRPAEFGIGMKRDLPRHPQSKFPPDEGKSRVFAELELTLSIVL